ncbi:MAG: LysR family transcriptional regulator [Planctomycetota bacterium]|jgi:DNA-binding transcriptional LysR family regulator
MYIQTLRIFSDLAQLRSFSKTADKYLLSQSAISQQLAQLELAHKCQLINRKKRPIELTREGQLLYDACRDIIERYEQFRTEINSLQKSSKSRINVAAIFSIGMHALPDYVKKFMVKYPKVHVHVEYLEAEKIYELVLAGDIDVGLVAIPSRDKRFEVYDFQNEQLVLACSPRHPLAGEAQIGIHRLQFERFISFGKDVPSRIWIDNILSQYNVIVQQVMEFDNIETIKRAVEINAGVSILPRTTVVQELDSGTIKAVSFSTGNFVRPTGIIIRKNKIQAPAIKYFIELLTEKTGRKEDAD